MFGSGALGASGNGAAPETGTNIGSPSYFVYSSTYFNGGFTSVTMLIEGEPTAAPVPEPATVTLLGLGLAGLGARRLRQRKQA